MKVTHVQTEESLSLQLLLDGFFASGNVYTRQILSDGTHQIAQCAREWLRFADETQDGDSWPMMVLPRKQNSKTLWYGLAFSGEQMRDLREGLTAFAGPTLSTLSNDSHLLDEDDPVEASLLRRSGGRVRAVTFDAGDDVERGRQLADALALMARARRNTQGREAELMLATGRVLRRFALALAARDRDAAESELLYLRRHRRLDALNLLFLEVQLRSELEAWPELLGLPRFSELAQVRRPLAVTRALLRGLFNTFLAPLESSASADVLRQTFRDQVRPKLGSLLDARAGMTTPEVLKLFLLQAVERQDELARRDLAPAVEGALVAAPAAERALWQELIGLLPAAPVVTPSSDPLQDALQALLEEDFDRAFDQALSSPAGVIRARVLLQCADALNAITRQQAATEAIEALPLPEREQLLSSPRSRTLWLKMTGTAEIVVTPVESLALSEPLPVAVPGSWAQWLDKIHDFSCSDPKVDAWAVQGADEWTLEPLQNADAIDTLCAKLQAGAQQGAVNGRMQNGLPHLVRFLERDEAFPRPAFRSLYANLRALLSLYGETSASAQWSVFAALCGAGLSIGANTSEFEQMLEETDVLWADRLAIANLGAALELLDTFFIYGGANSEKCRALAQMVLSRVPLWLKNCHLDAETWRFCRQLANDFGLTDLFSGLRYSSANEDDAEASAEDTDPLLLLAGKKVALHTLSEGEAIRTRGIIQTRCPTCIVEIDHSKAGNLGLEHLARNADVFVMVIRSAKHAATDFIETHRPDKTTLLRVNSRGSSSILRALSECAAPTGGTGGT